MRITHFLSAAIGVSCLFAVSALSAEEYKLLQQNKKFYLQSADGKIEKIKKLEINKGDKITFMNKDNISHNVYSKGDVADFEIAKQAPGASDTITFDKSGKTRLRCAIHPRMKLKVKVN